MDNVEERSLDQKSMAGLILMYREQLIEKLERFSEGRLLIWSEPKLFFCAGGEYEDQPGQWLEVRDASALFVRDAKYAIRGEKQWRVPTDEDAKQRPKCRVNKDGDWLGCSLIYVDPNDTGYGRFFVVDEDGDWFWVKDCEILDGGDDVPPPPQ